MVASSKKMICHAKATISELSCQFCNFNFITMTSLGLIEGIMLGEQCEVYILWVININIYPWVRIPTS